MRRDKRNYKPVRQLDQLSRLVLLIILVGVMALFLQDTTYAQTDEGDLIDYSQIRLLRWLGPDDPEPYGAYLLSHPRVPLVVAPLVIPVRPPSEELTKGRVLVYVNSTIHPSIQVRFDQYVADIMAEGYDVTTFLWTAGTAEDLKSHIITNSLDLLGCVLVGDLPCAWYEIEDDFSTYGYKDFPCDLFLMDLDGDWRDDNSTAPMQAGVYDIHEAGTGDVGPEIFIGRIDASMMTNDTEINHLNNYFDKLHDFYTGAMTPTDYGLTYTEDDWAASVSFTNDIASAYPNKDDILAPNTDRDDYRDNRLDVPDYEFIQLACHSSPTHHAFTRNGSLTSNAIMGIPPQALIYNLFCCSALRFTTNDFLGGAYIFNASTTSLATIGSTKTGAMLVFYAFYDQLGMGKSMGQSFKEWFEALAPYSFSEICWHYGMTIIGDPLIAPCARDNLDMMQVLDRSGSMGGAASATSSDLKIEVLRDASDQFVQIMKPDIGNQLGLVQFNQNVVSFDPAHQADLAELTSTRSSLLRSTAIPSIVHGGSTSIGDGLNEAHSQLTGSAGMADHNRKILLVSDGKENSDLRISDVQPNLVSDNIIVYPLGLGYGSGINETKLTDLATATGGTYRITADPLVFRKFFIEILAEASDWSVIIDPIDELDPGDSVSIPVTITANETGATFTAYWESVDYAVDFNLVTPDGTTITPNSISNKIRYGTHPRYSFYQIALPLGSNPNEWIGEWKMKILVSSRLASQKVRYSASCFGESGIALDASFDKHYNRTGEEVRITAHLTQNSQSITGAKINVYGNVPLVGFGNLLYEGKVNQNELNKISVVSGDTLSLIDSKLQILEERAQKDILLRGTQSMVLYDDGNHGDGAANDGYYANSFIDTKVQGSYTFRFVASDIPAGNGLTTTREWTKSFYNEVNYEFEYSQIDLQSISSTADGTRYQIKVLPKDRFNNVLGPGHNVQATVGDGKLITLIDNIDGTYSGSLLFTSNDLDDAKKAKIMINGLSFGHSSPPTGYNKNISIHGGAAVPIGSFADLYDPGINFMLDAGYWFTRQIAVIGFFGYNDFKAKNASYDDTHIINVSINGRYYQPYRLLPLPPWSYYIGGGLGAYIPKIGDTEFGFNLGAGLNYETNNRITLEIAIDYHQTFDDDIKFIHSHGGVIVKF